MAEINRKNITAEELKKLAEREGEVTALALFGKNIEVTVPVKQSLYAASIDELNMSVRSRNGLMRAGAHTVGRVCELIMSPGGIASVRNLGRKSISEIKTVLFSEAYERLNDGEKLLFWRAVLRDNSLE